MAALGVGLALRLVRVAQAPLLHPDGPAYIDRAIDLLHGKYASVLGGYYSPLYPAAVALLAATGLPAELAGRLASTLGGLAALPLLSLTVRRLFGEREAAAAVLTAALQPALVRASAEVLPEALAGTLLLGWLLALEAARGLAGFAGAGLLAGAAYLTRPEGILLVPLGLWGARHRRAPAVAAYTMAATLIVVPAVVVLHARTGHWQISPREARIAPRTGAQGDVTLVSAALRNPGALLAQIARGAAHQLAYDAKALGPLLWVPFAVGLHAAVPRGPRGWPLGIAASFTALPLALNPSPRYAAPLVPLILPWVGVGLVALGDRLGSQSHRRAQLLAAALAAALVVRALRVTHPSDAACSREVSSLLLERYGPGQALVAVDGRFAYYARGRALVPAGTKPVDALTLARSQGARLWLTRPAWLGRSWEPPAGARVVARPCGGALLLFELDSG